MYALWLFAVICFVCVSLLVPLPMFTKASKSCPVVDDLNFLINLQWTI